MSTTPVVSIRRLSVQASTNTKERGNLTALEQYVRPFVWHLLPVQLFSRDALFRVGAGLYRRQRGRFTTVAPVFLALITAVAAWRIALITRPPVKGGEHHPSIHHTQGGAHLGGWSTWAPGVLVGRKQTPPALPFCLACAACCQAAAHIFAAMCDGTPACFPVVPCGLRTRPSVPVRPRRRHSRIRQINRLRLPHSRSLVPPHRACSPVGPGGQIVLAG